MPSVDNRVVRMEFDNAEFERRLQTTLGSLKQLETALKMEGAKKGLADASIAAGKLGTGISSGLAGAHKSVNDLNTAASKFSVEGISRGIEGVNKGFIAMSTIAITALSNVTSAAINAGKNIAKSLGLENVIAGFQEYETNMNSIQTILSNTKADGTNLGQVNDALNQLNTYADKTIYNFSQMTRNIGTFTAAGIKLGPSVQAIKGISNLAAISGSSADQASTAMYQLSQALASGTVKLQDWNSVVNAGMGGEVFQKTLFETGKALGTLKNVPLQQSFADWKKEGNSFRESLKDGWVNADVLTTALQSFTGEMTVAQLEAKGFSKTVAEGMVEMGKTGLDAATRVRTFTQLIDTTKEAIGSGWGTSFRIILGDFNQATDLFSGFNRVISGIVGNMAQTRNNILTAWAKLGGRNSIISGVYLGFANLFKLLRTIKGAFRDVFPPITGKRLAELSENFRKLMVALEPSKKTLNELRRIFRGLFAIFSIGFTIIKNVVGLFLSLGRAIAGAAGPGTLDFLAKIGDFFYNLQQGLVKGKGIDAFFANLTKSIQGLVPYLKDAVNFIGDLFSSIGGGASKAASTAAEKSLGRVGDRVKVLGEEFDNVKKALAPIKKVLQVIGQVFAAIGRALDAFGQKLAETFSGGNFNKILDLVNTGLFAGLLLLIHKFIKQGLKLDIGGGLFGSIKKSFDQLTKTLKQLQTKIKADTLLRIAEALGVLTLSLVVLSLIDSAALTKALVAASVGFGQLLGVLKLLDKMQIGPKTALTFGILSASLVVLSVGMLIFAGAAKKLGTLNMGELAKGLIGISVGLAAMIGALKLMSLIKGTDFVKAGVGLIAIAISLFFLGRAVSAFAGMNLGEMAKGFVGVSVGLTALAGALHLMPDEKKLPGTKMITTAIGLRILADTVKEFAKMSWADLTKGLAAVGILLAGVAIAFNKMPEPVKMQGIAVGLLAMSVSLLIISKAVKSMGGMSLPEIAKGLLALGGAMLILVLGANAMESALPGALALIVLAGALTVLVTVIKALSLLGFDTVITGMAKLAIAIGILALTSSALSETIPFLLAMGAALALVGAAFALFGAGAVGVAKAFEILNRAGKHGADGFLKAIDAILKVLPTVAAALARASLDFLAGFLAGVPQLLGAFEKVISMLLDLVIKLIPKFQQVLGALITAGLATIRTFAGEYIKTGLFILTSLIQGIADNIGQVADAAVDIIVNFINAIANRMTDIVGAGLNLLLALLRGIANNLGRIVSTVTDIIVKFTTELASNYQKIIDAGFNILKQFLKGIGDNLVSIVTTVGDVVTRFITELGNNASRIATAGADALIHFLNGIKDRGPRVIKAFAEAGVTVVSSFLDAISASVVTLAKKVITTFTNFFNALADVIRNNTKDLGDAMGNFAESLVSGFGNVFFGAMKKMVKDAIPGGIFAGPIRTAVDKVFDTLGIHSPSTVMLYVGEMLMAGFTKGIEDNESNPANALNAALVKVSDTLSNTTEFNPVITPVLDLTRVAASASLINGMIPSANVGTFSTAQANTIASSELDRTTSNLENAPGAKIEKMFEQNIYAPEQLSMAAIYKQTRNQIIMAKEELKIP